MTRICVAAFFRGMTVAPMPAGRGLLPLADVADRQRRDGPSQLVIRRKHPVVAMPVLPRRGHEIGEPVEELKRREFDDAIGTGPRGLAAAASRRRASRNHRITRRRTRSVSTARSTGVIDRGD